MPLKKDPNFEEKMTFCLKNDMSNLVNFTASSGLLFKKVCNVCAKKIQSSFFVKNWLMVVKMASVSWWIFTQVVESAVR